MMIVLGLVAFFLMRIYTLVHSIRNEKRLLRKGAVEYGKTNTKMLTALHVLFYTGAVVELLSAESLTLSTLRIIGAVLFLFSYIILWIVINQLGEIWTVKIYILKQHTVNKSFLFKYFKHPNYFLNVIPELIGIGLFCNAWYTMAVVLPIYAIVLGIRIAQEEKAMQGL